MARQKFAGSSRTRKAATVTLTRFAVGYDGVAPFPDSGARQRTPGGRVQAAALTIVLVPFAGLAAAVWLAWGHGVGLTDIVLAVTFYMVTGLGISVGLHRLLTHRAFTRRAGAAGRARGGRP